MKQDIENTIKTNTLDGRTREARRLKEIEQGLADDPIKTAKSLLKSIVAQDMLIAEEIHRAALNAGCLVDSKGKLNPLIEKSLVKHQNSARAALTEYLRLDGSKPNDTDPEDVFGGVFE